MMSQLCARTFQARYALLRELVPHYQQASPAQKTLLLDTLVERTGYTRNYAVALWRYWKDRGTCSSRKKSASRCSS